MLWSPVAPTYGADFALISMHVHRRSILIPTGKAFITTRADGALYFIVYYPQLCFFLRVESCTKKHYFAEFTRRITKAQILYFVYIICCFNVFLILSCKMSWVLSVDSQHESTLKSKLDFATW